MPISWSLDRESYRLIVGLALCGAVLWADSITPSTYVEACLLTLVPLAIFPAKRLSTVVVITLAALTALVLGALLESFVSSIEAVIQNRAIIALVLIAGGAFIGYATMKPRSGDLVSRYGDQVNELIDRAQTALDAARRSGGDRVQAAPRQTPTTTISGRKDRDSPS